MSNVIRKALPVIVLQAAFFALPAWAQSAGLDGKVFVADAGEKGKEADERGDLITFASGTFHSSACDKYGFQKAAYRSADGKTFDAETLSEKDGRIVWTGRVQGDTIEGTFVHYPKGWLLNPNPAPVEHWFKGKAKS
jgi:hypothetical protein